MRDIIREDCEELLSKIDLEPLRGKRVLITGANGLLGQYIAALVLVADAQMKLKVQLTCVSLHGPNKYLKQFMSQPRFHFKKINLAKPFRIEGKFDYVAHMAGYGQPAKFMDDPMATLALNTQGTYRLLDLTKKSKGRFVFASSAEVYGNIPKKMGAVPETYEGASSTLSPRAMYGEAKRLGEVLVSLFAKEGVDAHIVRISHTYGPGASLQDSRVLSDFIRKGLFKKEISLLDAGASIKTYGYVGDVAAMIMHVLLHGKAPVYNVGGNDSLRIRDLAREVGQIIKAPVKIPKTSARLAHVGSDPGFVRLDLRKVLNEMKGFRLTPFKKGLARTIEWSKVEYLD